MPRQGEQRRAASSPGAGWTRVSPGVYQYSGSGGTQSSSGTKAPKGGFLATLPKDISALLSGSNLKTPTGAITGQQTLNEYNAGRNELLNRPNEYGTFGSRQYTTGADGRVTIRDTLSNPQQQINTGRENLDISNLQGANTLSSQARDVMSRGYDISGAPQVQGYDPSTFSALPDTSQLQTNVQNQLNDYWEQRNAPIFEQEKKALEQNLADRGIPVGSELWNQQMQKMSDQQTRSRQDARIDALSQGTDQARTQFGMAYDTRNLQGSEQLNRFDAQGQLRDRYTNEYERQRYAPLAESKMFSSDVRGVVNPQFQGMANVDVGNVDLPGTYLGYGSYNLAQQAAARSGSSGGGRAGGGGGGRQPNYFSDILQLQQSLQNDSGGDSTGGWGSVGASFGSGLGQGAVLGGMNRKSGMLGRNPWAV